MTSAVGEVTWLTSAKRVRGVTASRYASTACAGSLMGNGIRARTTFAPSRSAAACSALSVALYSWSQASSSSPGWNRTDPSTVDTPVVALDTKARPSGSAPRNAATSIRTASSCRLELAVEEPHGLGLEAVAPCPLGLEDGRGARPERAVVEVRDLGIQQPGRAVEGPMGHVATIADPGSGDRVVPRRRG